MQSPKLFVCKELKAVIQLHDFMGPLTVITGIFLGSCLSIAVSLAAVLLMVSLVGSDDPRLDHEFPALFASMLIFVVLTTICAASFYLMLKQHPARWISQGMMWMALAGTGFYFWP
ncbi:MAG: hypothetical protein RLN69_01780 [Woeseiaceae bacterium]